MKVNIKVTFDITFDAVGGSSKTNLTFTLPKHPKLEISDDVKKITVEEIQGLCQAMLDRKVFQ